MFIKENELKCARFWTMEVEECGISFKGKITMTVLRQIFYKAAFVKGELYCFK